MRGTPWTCARARATTEARATIGGGVRRRTRARGGGEDAHRAFVSKRSMRAGLGAVTTTTTTTTRGASERALSIGMGGGYARGARAPASVSASMEEEGDGDGLVPKPLGAAEALRRAAFPIFVAALGAFSFGYHCGVVNPALEALSVDIGIAGNLAAEGAVVSSMLFGAAVGSFTAGGFADKRGRKASLAIAGVVLAVGSALCAMAMSLNGMLLGRLLVGLGVGLVSILVPMYVSEVSPPAHRGILGSGPQLSIGCGILFAMLFGLPLQSADVNPTWWRKDVLDRVRSELCSLRSRTGSPRVRLGCARREGFKRRTRSNPSNSARACPSRWMTRRRQKWRRGEKLYKDARTEEPSSLDPVYSSFNNSQASTPSFTLARASFKALGLSRASPRRSPCASSISLEV